MQWVQYLWFMVLWTFFNCSSQGFKATTSLGGHKAIVETSLSMAFRHLQTQISDYLTPRGLQTKTLYTSLFHGDLNGAIRGYTWDFMVIYWDVMVFQWWLKDISSGFFIEDWRCSELNGSNGTKKSHGSSALPIHLFVSSGATKFLGFYSGPSTQYCSGLTLVPVDWNHSKENGYLYIVLTNMTSWWYTYPSEKIWVRQLGCYSIPNWMEIHKIIRKKSCSSHHQADSVHGQNCRILLMQQGVNRCLPPGFPQRQLLPL